MNILNKIVFGTMSISDKNNSVNLLEYALKNFNTFHLSSEYKSFKKISKIFKEKKTNLILKLAEPNFNQRYFSKKRFLDKLKFYQKKLGYDKKDFNPMDVARQFIE